MMPMEEWKHMFKLDPAKEISDEHLEKICESGTDAVIVGGTDQITLDNVLDLLSRIRRYMVPCILEISEIDAVTPGFDYYFIPMVLNSQDKKWMMDIHHQAVKQYKHLIGMAEFFVEGYCILNESSKAFQKTNCTLPTEEDVIAYAFMAEQMFNFPYFYLEYSGTYGDPKLVQRIKSELTETKLIYGGGITNATEARQMKEYADIIVVGNSIYTSFQDALNTVAAVKS